MSLRTQIAGGLLGAILAILTLLRFGVSWELPAYAYMCAISVVLGIIDFRHKLLPNRYMFPGMLIAPALVAFAVLGQRDWSDFTTAILGGASMFLLYLAMALITPGGIGMGDVKLAAILGIFLGFLGWGVWFVGLFSAFVIGGLAGLVLLIAGKAKRTTTIPFGPPMLLGALIAIFWGSPLIDAIFPNAA